MDLTSYFTSTNFWHHIAAVRSGGTLKYYINGSLKKSQSGFPTGAIDAEKVYFGND